MEPVRPTDSRSFLRQRGRAPVRIPLLLEPARFQESEHPQRVSFFGLGAAQARKGTWIPHNTRTMPPISAER